MRQFAAHYLFTGNNLPIKKGIVEIDDVGMISQVIDFGEEFHEVAGLEFHNGIICPGFINLFKIYSFEEFFSFFTELKEFEDLLSVKPETEKDLLEWMKKIHQQQDAPSLEQMIRIFTIESAKIINQQQKLGTVEPGKQPGLLLIFNMDYPNQRLTVNSRLKKLI